MQLAWSQLTSQAHMIWTVHMCRRPHVETVKVSLQMVTGRRRTSSWKVCAWAQHIFFWLIYLQWKNQRNDDKAKSVCLFQSLLVWFRSIMVLPQPNTVSQIPCRLNVVTGPGHVSCSRLIDNSFLLLCWSLWSQIQEFFPNYYHTPFHQQTIQHTILTLVTRTWVMLRALIRIGYQRQVCITPKWNQY